MKSNRRMSAVEILIPLLLLAVNLPAGAQQEQPAATLTIKQKDAALARARELRDLLLDRKWEAFLFEGNEQLRLGLPAEKLDSIWMQLEDRFGAYRHEVHAKVEGTPNLRIVTLGSKFDNGLLNIVITLDQEDRMTSFFLRPNPTVAPYEPPDYARLAALRNEKLYLDAGKYPLEATFSIPVGAGPLKGFPGVLLVHGSGNHDQDETIFSNKPFLDLAWGLASKGVVVLRYEKRTYRYPHAHGDSITLEQEVIEDALKGVQMLKGRTDVDPERVFVLGHSLGGTAAPFIAKSASDLGGIILLAGASRPMTDLIEDQVAYIVNVDGQITDEEQELLDTVKTGLAEVRAGKLDGEPIVKVPRRYLDMMKNYDPVPVAQSLSLPILVVQGGRDYQVTEKDWNLWKQGLADKPNVQFKLFPDCNHLFVAGAGASSPDEYYHADHVAHEVIQFLADWIRAH